MSAWVLTPINFRVAQRTDIMTWVSTQKAAFKPFLSRATGLSLLVFAENRCGGRLGAGVALHDLDVQGTHSARSLSRNACTTLVLNHGCRILRLSSR
jgi:hypothetical protein